MKESAATLCRSSIAVTCDLLATSDERATNAQGSRKEKENESKGKGREDFRFDTDDGQAIEISGRHCSQIYS